MAIFCPSQAVLLALLSQGCLASQAPLKGAEGAVRLERLYPISTENYPAFEAGSLIQMHESRVPHRHTSRLRETHAKVRDQASSFFQVDDTPHSLEEKGHIDGALDSHMAAIRMTNLKDSQYVGPLMVGSQRDILSVVYDTGSTNLWFASTLCKVGSCLKRRRYDPSSSSTYKQGNYDLHVTFGTGELSGQQGVDDVEMAGFKVKQQAFSMIEKEQGSIFDQLDFEGILGLAFPAMSANKVTPFFSSLMEQQVLKENAVSFYFTKLPTDASAVFFGEVDDRLYEGKLTGIPVTEQYYWMVDLKEFKIGDKVINGPKKVVFDSGTTYYTAPKTIMPTVLAELPQSDCKAIRDGTSKLPDLTFTLIGKEGKEVPLTIKPNEYYVSSGGDAICDPAWMTIEVPSPHGPAWIFGEAFMRTFFTSFHRGDGKSTPEIRVAPLRHDMMKLVQGIKKDEGMSANQKKIEASLLSQQSYSESNKMRRTVQPHLRGN